MIAYDPDPTIPRAYLLTLLVDSYVRETCRAVRSLYDSSVFNVGLYQLAIVRLQLCSDELWLILKIRSELIVQKILPFFLSSKML